MLRNGAIVRPTTDGIFLYDFTDLEHYTGTLSDDWRLIFWSDCKRIRQRYYKSYGKVPMLSHPYYSQTSRGVDTPLRRAEIILLDENGMSSLMIDDLHSPVFGPEEIEPTPVAPYMILGYWDQRYKPRGLSDPPSYFASVDEVFFGHRHTLIREGGQLRLVSVTQHRGVTNNRDGPEEDDQLLVENLKIPMSAMQRAQFDESIGRIIVMDESKNSCKIYDFFV